MRQANFTKIKAKVEREDAANTCGVEQIMMDLIDNSRFCAIKVFES